MTRFFRGKKGLFAALGAFVVIAALVFLPGCTANERARKWGGTQEIKLQPGKKLVTATWKEDSIWYLVRDMRSDEKPESLEFVQQSSYGVFEGKVVFVEQKK